MGRVHMCPGFFCDGYGLPVMAEQGYSMGKAIAGTAIGGILGGTPGAIIGSTAGLRSKAKVTFVCTKCGRSWTERM